MYGLTATINLDQASLPYPPAATLPQTFTHSILVCQHFSVHPNINATAHAVWNYSVH